MPRKKKELTDKELSKIREVEAYEHKAHERANNPKAGYARYDRVHEEATKYAYDPHIDPTLQWAGKQEALNVKVVVSNSSNFICASTDYAPDSTVCSKWAA